MGHDEVRGTFAENSMLGFEHLTKGGERFGYVVGGDKIFSQLVMLGDRACVSVSSAQSIGPQCLAPSVHRKAHLFLQIGKG